MTAPKPLLQTRNVGRLTVHAIQAGGQMLDGGAMFGVVPKPLWERRIPADERNRIPMGMRCLLIEHPEGLVLVDTGAGNKEDRKFHEIYGVENEGRAGRTMLEDGIMEAGYSWDDVTLVINTHLHFDHAGGNTLVDHEGTIHPSFPNARYVVQAGEHRYASRANERTQASYFPRNYEPLLKSGQMEFVTGESELRSGVRVVPTPGHTPHHQSVLVESDGETLIFLADLVPTAAHLPLPWIMGYDVEPLVTLETKRRVLAQAAQGGWLCVFEHDATTAWGRVEHDGRSYRLAPAE